jgi:class 3 adenylate cyclase
LVRGELGAHRGREVKTIGDGFLTRFDSLAAGSGIHLAARGKQKLRGVEGEYDLLAVED